MLLGNKNLDNINALPWKFQMPESREALAQTSAKRGGECQFLMPTSWDAAPEGQQTFKWVPSPQGTHGANAKWGRGQKSHHR